MLGDEGVIISRIKGVHMDQNLENRIRERGMHGQAEQHWLAAEREILAASTAALAGKLAPKKKQRSQARSKTVKTLAMAG